MSTPDRAEINRRNAQKSTGPRTVEGKKRSRLNALKHGMTATMPVLPGESAEVLQARVDAWTDDLQPRNSLEQDLVDRAAQVSWRLDRVERAHIARLTANIQGASSIIVSPQEQEEVLLLGRRLFWDRRGPVVHYPTVSDRGYCVSNEPRTSWSGLSDDPDDPARLRNGWNRL